MSPEERGDLVEALLPDAAGLAVAVREEPQEKIAARVAGLSRHELEALAVILAAMVDPDRGLREAFGWINFDEYGEPLTGRRPESIRTVRSTARKEQLDRAHGVDLVAVDRALAGDRGVELTQTERAAAVDRGLRRGMSYDLVAELLDMDREAVKRSWERSKRRARQNGQYVPTARVGEIAA